MKYRSDFVTNSSSSSFIVAFHSYDEGISQISKMTEEYGTKFVEQLLSDFRDACPIAKEDIGIRFRSDIESDVSHQVDYKEVRYWRDDDTSDFKRDWMESHPGTEVWDYWNSLERQAKVDELADIETTAILADIGDRDYVVELDYADDDHVGSCLEHDIMPKQSFTVRRFSHH